MPIPRDPSLYHHDGTVEYWGPFVLDRSPAPSPPPSGAYDTLGESQAQVDVAIDEALASLTVGETRQEPPVHVDDTPVEEALASLNVTEAQSEVEASRESSGSSRANGVEEDAHDDFEGGLLEMLEEHRRNFPEQAVERASTLSSAPVVVSSADSTLAALLESSISIEDPSASMDNSAGDISDEDEFEDVRPRDRGNVEGGPSAEGESEIVLPSIEGNDYSDEDSSDEDEFEDARLPDTGDVEGKPSTGGEPETVLPSIEENESSNNDSTEDEFGGVLSPDTGDVEGGPSTEGEPEVVLPSVEESDSSNNDSSVGDELGAVLLPNVDMGYVDGRPFAEGEAEIVIPSVEGRGSSNDDSSCQEVNDPMDFELIAGEGSSYIGVTKGAENVPEPMEFSWQAFYVAYPAGPDHSNLSNYDGTFGYKFVEDMRHALADVVEGRDFPAVDVDDNVSRDVRTACTSTVVEEEAAGQPTTTNLDQAVLAELCGISGSEFYSLPACGSPPLAGGAQEYDADARKHLLDLAKRDPEQWALLIGMYTQEVLLPRAYANWGSVVGGEGIPCGEWVPNLALPVWRQFRPEHCVSPFSWPKGPKESVLKFNANLIMRHEHVFWDVVKQWVFELNWWAERVLKNALAQAGFIPTYSACLAESMARDVLQQVLAGTEYRSIW